ncbi:MAG: SAF domain-containing protein [Acidimicrobiales bacterium]
MACSHGRVRCLAHRLTSLIDDERAGQTVGVRVAIQSIEPGVRLDELTTTIRQWPVGLVPDGALAADDVAFVSRSAINAGEVITSARVIGPSGLAAGENSLLVPTVLRRDDLAVGDAVTVYGLTPIGSNDSVVGAAAAPIGRGRAVEVYDEAVAVALPESLVSPVLEFVVLGAIEIVKRPS